jgi:site-specific recombinase XerD
VHRHVEEAGVSSAAGVRRGTRAALGVLPADAADPESQELIASQPGEEPGNRQGLDQRQRVLRPAGTRNGTSATDREVTFFEVEGFVAERTGKQPSVLDIGDLDAPLVADFLDHLERDRLNTVRTRNSRLAAVHSLFGYAALRHPEHAASIQRVLAIPPKRFERNLVTYLTEQEVDAVLASCDRTTWTGRRDHAMLVLAVQTGLRISELVGLRCQDLVLGAGPHVHCLGKGRKERRTPLLPLTVRVMRAWLAERAGASAQPLFPSVAGNVLSRDAVEHRLALYVTKAGTSCPSIKAKKVTYAVCRSDMMLRARTRATSTSGTPSARTPCAAGASTT